MRHALVLGLLLSTSAASALAAPKVWNQAWTVAGTPEIKVVTDDAHVRIHAGPAGSVSAKVSYELKRWGIMVGGGEPTVVFEHQGDRITITARDPKTFGIIGGMDENYTVDVIVPPSATLNVRTSDGSIDCDPLTGSFQFRSGDGAIRAHGLKGTIDYSSGDGRIIMDDLDGKLSGRAGDGSARISGRFDLIDVASADGRIEVRAVKGSKAASDWSLETADGSLKLDIPLDLAALLDCRTRDGSLHNNLPIDTGKDGRPHEILGELNGGGPRLRMRTGDGTLTIGVSE